MGLFMALVGLMGGAFGWIVRSTAAAISGLVGVLLILPVILGLFPGSFGTTVAKYLPSNVGESFVASFHNPELLAPWAGIAVFTALVGRRAGRRRRGGPPARHLTPRSAPLRRRGVVGPALRLRTCSRSPPSIPISGSRSSRPSTPQPARHSRESEPARRAGLRLGTLSERCELVDGRTQDDHHVDELRLRVDVGLRSRVWARTVLASSPRSPPIPRKLVRPPDRAAMVKSSRSMFSTLRTLGDVVEVAADDRCDIAREEACATTRAAGLHPGVAAGDQHRRGGGASDGHPGQLGTWSSKSRLIARSNWGARRISSMATGPAMSATKAGRIRSRRACRGLIVEADDARGVLRLDDVGDERALADLSRAEERHLASLAQRLHEIATDVPGRSSSSGQILNKPWTDCDLSRGRIWNRPRLRSRRPSLSHRLGRR